MAKLHALGAGQEVGRSGFVLDTGTEKLLLDYGMKVSTGIEGSDQPEFPMEAPSDLDAMLVSHAHMDHGGFVPSLYRRGWSGSTFATATTFDLMELLLRDSIKLAKLFNHELGYWYQDVEKMQKHSFRVAYGQQFEVGNSWISYHDAGHIPGSAQILIESNGKNFVYTGDLKEDKTELLNGLKTIDADVDVLITESTYGMKDHPDREKTEKELMKIIRETLHQDGHVLISSFAVGRAQELLLAMEKFKIDVPIYVDGMASTATDIVLKYSEFLRYPTMLKRAFNSAKKIRNSDMRKKVLKEPCVVISTSGMLNGGPIEYYIEKLKDDKKSHLIMTGYQAEGSSGRHLIETGNEYFSQTKKFKLNIPWTKLDFSAHAGQKELIRYFKSMSPENIVCVHGDQTQEFARFLKENYGFNAFAPANGDILAF